MDPELKGDEQPFQDIEMRNVDGHLALVGDMFADELMGWALVRVREDEASSQTVLTNNRLYEQYITEEGLQRTATSYGGLTEAVYMRPEIDDDDA